MNKKLLDEAVRLVESKWPDVRPGTALILGSGWGSVVDKMEVTGELEYGDIPGLGHAGVQGHAGRLVRVRFQERELLIFQGRRHWYEGEGWTPTAVPVYIARHLQCRHLLITNAAGGLNPSMKPGNLMIIQDHINMLGSNPLMGPHDPAWGPRFPDMTEAYDGALRALLQRSAHEAGSTFFEGVYLAASGPSYETPAEIKAFRKLGADAVGMSTVPEVILANAAGLRVAGLTCITNMASGISKNELSHQEVIESTAKAMPQMEETVKRFLMKEERLFTC